jgi:single-strand DNA-binding protein
MENVMYVIGNLTADPTLRGTTDKPRATFTVMVNETRNNEEVSHPINVTAFGTLAQNLAGSLKKGHRVIVEGRIGSYKKAVVINEENVEITMLAMTASSVGPDLRWATAVVTKVRRSEGNASGTEAASGTTTPTATASASTSKPSAAAAVTDNAEDF